MILTTDNNRVIREKELEKYIQRCVDSNHISTHLQKNIICFLCVLKDIFGDKLDIPDVYPTHNNGVVLSWYYGYGEEYLDNCTIHIYCINKDSDDVGVGVIIDSAKVNNFRREDAIFSHDITFSHNTQKISKRFLKGIKFFMKAVKGWEK